MEIIRNIKKDDGIGDLKKRFEEGRVVLGTKRTLKLLKKNKIEIIYVSSTAPKFVLDLKELKEIEMNKLNIDAVGLGKLLGKNFPVSVAGVLK